MNLNDSQMRAVEHFDGPCLVIAGPGSGKTAVLTRRVERLIERRVSPEKICVITFTKAAATEMRERFMKQSGEGDGVVFATFHSLFFSILSKECKLKSDNILMGKQKTSLLKTALSDCDFSNSDKEILSVVSSEISYINNSSIEIDDYKSKKIDNEKLKKAYKNYACLKEKYGLIDFDDMLIKTYRLFLKNPEILRKWQARFDYFLIDEMQDMNELQYRLIGLLSENKKNVFGVGDDDQSIYSFRGASPSLMQDFEKSYPGCERIVLEQNYRCPANIVASSLELISNNKVRFEKSIQANRGDGLIEVIKAQDKKNEAKIVSDKIKMLLADGEKPEDIAVLYRNHHEAEYLIDRFLMERIPFFLKDRMPNVYSSFIFEDMLSYFQIAIGNATRERMLLIMNKPNRFIMRAALEEGYSFSKIEKFYEGNQTMKTRVLALERDIELIGKMTAYGAANYIRQAVGYGDYLKELSIINGAEMASYQENFDFFLETVKDCKTIKKAIEKISFLRLKVDFENRAKEKDREGKIGLYTLHSSKGLEFNDVFIIGVNEGILPSKQAGNEEETEGERRLFYVGVTRAKEKLFISYLNEKNRDRIYPSRFIDELGLDAYSSSPKASS